MAHVAVYRDRSDQRNVFVLNIMSLETGSRVRYKYAPDGKEQTLGRNNFKKAYAHVAGVLV